MKDDTSDGTGGPEGDAGGGGTALDRARAEFYAKISHEFRTPLTLILAPAEEALADAAAPLPDAQRERLEVVRRNAVRLLRKIDALLDFSRVETGDASGTFEPTDLAALTSEIARLFAPALGRAGLALELACPALPEEAFVDRGMWERIVLNLLSNALKFTFHGKVGVALALEGEFFRLSVSDTGGGIPARELPHVFERFHRVAGARTRTQEGMGLGLAVVRELARVHGGDTFVTSTPGAGTTFTVTVRRGSAHLPAGRVGSGRPIGALSPAASPFVEEADRWLPFDRPTTVALDANAPRRRILLADGDAELRGYLRSVLETAFDVEVAPDGAATVVAAGERAPDLIIADASMPELDGLGLLHALRGDERTRAVPVLLLSADASEYAKIEALEAGADDYLVKPFSGRELLARARTHLALTDVRRRLGRQEIERSDLRQAIGDLARSNRELEQFAYVASHDLQEPLRMIAGFVQLLARRYKGKLDEDADRFINHTVDGVVRMQRIIGDLLAYSRVGRHERPFTRVELAAVLEDVTSALEPAARDAGAVITSDPLPAVIGDKGLLEQLLQNLIANAIKFHGQDPPRIHVGARRVADREEISVSDNGIGIEPRHFERIFIIFQRLHARGTYEGTGVGLAICKKIVERHGGRLWLESEPGKGSTFRFTVAAAPA